jgi:chromosome partitioning protein
MTAKIFTVENRKGGVGKTTTAVTLAVGLARRCHENGGGNVLLIDLDPQGDAARGLGLEPKGRCVSNVLTGSGGLTELKANIMPADRKATGGPSRPNLYVLPASDALANAKTKIISQIAADAAANAVAAIFGQQKPTTSNEDDIVMLLERKLAIARQAFKYIILDCPPTLDVLQQSVHHFADAAIVPVKVDYHGTSATARHTQNILDDQAEGIEITIKAIVPTFYYPRHNLTQAMMDDLAGRYGRKVIMTPIPNTVRVAEAPAVNGLTIFEYEPGHPAAEAYWDLVDYIRSDK